MAHNDKQLNTNIEFLYKNSCILLCILKRIIDKLRIYKML